MKIAVREFFRQEWCQKGLFFCLMGTVLTVLCWSSGVFALEPSYHGKTAKEWLDDPVYVSGNLDYGSAEAAFRAMGPEGARFLARMLGKQPGQLSKIVKHLIENFNFLDSVVPRQIRRDNADRLENRQSTATLILLDLQTNAEPAVPILANLYRRDHSYQVERVLEKLGYTLEFMVPYLIKDLGQSGKSNDEITMDVRLLEALGPKAKPAIPVLRKVWIGWPEQQDVAIAFWNITRETNELADLLSTSLAKRDASPVYLLARIWGDAMPPPHPLLPLVTQALKHPELQVRYYASLVLDKMDPGQLRQIKEELNAHQEELLPEHLLRLQSTNAIDRSNAEMALHFYGPKAAAAVPRLVEIIEFPNQKFLVGTGQPVRDDRIAALSTIRSIGPMAGAATPALIRLLQTNLFSPESICDVLAHIGPPAMAALPALQALLESNTFKDRTLPRGFQRPGNRMMPGTQAAARWAIAQAIASIDPHDSNAIAILRLEAAESKDVPLPPASSAITLWKLGLETNLPIDELMRYNYFEALGDIGPAAKKALPSIEKYLQGNPDAIDVSLAIWRIDPDEGKRLGLPGLFILCPDKY